MVAYWQTEEQIEIPRWEPHCSDSVKKSIWRIQQVSSRGAPTDLCCSVASIRYACCGVLSGSHPKRNHATTRPTRLWVTMAISQSETEIWMLIAQLFQTLVEYVG